MTEHVEAVTFSLSDSDTTEVGLLWGSNLGPIQLEN